VGFNPFRARVSRRSDIVIVSAAFVVIIAMVLWAALGH
jgi:hypothetical protein